jgi:hypothetical protein
MKTKITQRRVKAVKRGTCGMCKPWKKGWAGKRTVSEVRQAQGAEQQLSEIRVSER